MNQKVGSFVKKEVTEDLGVLYERLLDNLDRELSVQQSMRQLLEEERAALTLASVEAIQETNARKETLLLKEKETNTDRQDIVARVSTLPGWEGKTVTLSSLAETASDTNTADRLRQRQQALRDVTKAIRVQNQKNMELINAAINDVQGALHLIQSMVSPGVSYHKTGQLSLRSTQGSFIHREG